MLYFNFYVLSTCIYLRSVYSQISHCSSEDGSCSHVTGASHKYTAFRDYKLPRIVPGKVGLATKTDVIPDRRHRRFTRAKNPPIFEIPDFLTAKECEHIIYLAEKKGYANDTYFGGRKMSRSVYRREVSFIKSKEDDVLQAIRRRVSVLTKMPIDLVEESEPLQVGRYAAGGHQGPRFDSSETTNKSLAELPCCHQIRQQDNKQCIICRYMTVLFYLNDVSRGGELVFPLADTQSTTVTAKQTNPAKYCYEASVVLKPKKGTAVMWYNNYRNPETGWLGFRDPRSLHGTCPVLDGHQWIANLWLWAPQYERRYEETVLWN